MIKRVIETAILCLVGSAFIAISAWAGLYVLRPIGIEHRITGTATLATPILYANTSNLRIKPQPSLAVQPEAVTVLGAESQSPLAVSQQEHDFSQPVLPESQPSLAVSQQEHNFSEPVLTEPQPSLAVSQQEHNFSEPVLTAGSISLVMPIPRPAREDVYPPTPLTLEEGFTALTGITPTAQSTDLSLRSGESLAPMLKRGGFTAQQTNQATVLISKHLSLRRLPVGFEVAILPSTDTNGAGLRVQIDDDLDLTLAQNGDGTWQKRISIRPIDRYLSYVSGQIDLSLYEAGIKAGMSDAIFNGFVQVLAFSVDFQREIRQGDSFEALFETKKDRLTGRNVKTAQLYYISMVLSGKKIEFFHHTHQDGTQGWYDEAGNSAVRTLMRTPVNGARLSSGYGTRKHPILGYSKKHTGVDFAAPTGTPIMAAGSGVIEAAGRNGAYGIYMRIRHNSTYKTAYAHLSRINKGMTPGTRVSQGDIIGFVGNTGRSTGPHLHYEIIVNNRKVNPLTVQLPTAASMPSDERPYFSQTISNIKAELNARGLVRFASQ